MPLQRPILGNKLYKNIIRAVTLSYNIKGKKPDRSCFYKYFIFGCPRSLS